MAKNTDLLDITDFSPKFALDRQQVVEEICLEIVKRVMSTQAFVVQPLPNILLMTRDQFDVLRPDMESEPQDELYWKTVHPTRIDPKTGRLEIINIMDIHVRGEFEPTPQNLLLLN